jgi:signal peptidase I
MRAEARVPGGARDAAFYNAIGMTPEPSDAVPPAGPAAAPSHRGLGRVLTVLRDVIFAVLLAIVLIVFIYQPVRVEGVSMEPTLSDQERIFIDKFGIRFGIGSIVRGDTVVFHYDESKSYIKRVIGLPGDRVHIDAGRVFVNGKAIEEDYVPERSRDTISWPSADSHTDAVVPADMYFVLGDNRSQSSDSRAWGYVDRKSIYGKAVFVYWPPARIGRLR